MEMPKKTINWAKFRQKFKGKKNFQKMTKSKNMEKRKWNEIVKKGECLFEGMNEEMFLKDQRRIVYWDRWHEATKCQECGYYYIKGDAKYEERHEKICREKQGNELSRKGKKAYVREQQRKGQQAFNWNYDTVMFKAALERQKDEVISKVCGKLYEKSGVKMRNTVINK